MAKLIITHRTTADPTYFFKDGRHVGQAPVPRSAAAGSFPPGVELAYLGENWLPPGGSVLHLVATPQAGMGAVWVYTEDIEAIPSEPSSRDSRTRWERLLTDPLDGV
jgi:hypothetical protein